MAHNNAVANGNNFKLHTVLPLRLDFLLRSITHSKLMAARDRFNADTQCSGLATRKQYNLPINLDCKKWRLQKVATLYCLPGYRQHKGRGQEGRSLSCSSIHKQHCSAGLTLAQHC